MKTKCEVCMRKTCKFNCPTMSNGCEILSSVYDNNFKCAFYKSRKGKKDGNKN